ncbi:MAG: GNAT family N-acetyltransferase [bacterium]
MFESIFPKKNFELEKIEIKYTKNILPELVQSLYLSVGWQYREIKDIKNSLNKSILITSAWDKQSLIGIARATGDGVFNATIWDVAVNPSYQNFGIGKLIIKSMLTKLDDYDIPLITLYTKWAKKDFYSKLGFESNLNTVIGMYRYKKNNKYKDKKRRNE